MKRRSSARSRAIDSGARPSTYISVSSRERRDLNCGPIRACSSRRISRASAMRSATAPSTSSARTCAPIWMASRCAMSSIGSAATSVLLMSAGDALTRALHDEGQKRQADEQHCQGQEHVGKGHDYALAMGERVELFDGHELGICAEVGEALHHAVECLNGRLARPGSHLVQTGQV